MGLMYNLLITTHVYLDCEIIMCWLNHILYSWYFILVVEHRIIPYKLILLQI